MGVGVLAPKSGLLPVLLAVLSSYYQNERICNLLACSSLCIMAVVTPIVVVGGLCVWFALAPPAVVTVLKAAPGGCALLLDCVLLFSVQVDPKVAFPRQSNPTSSQPKVKTLSAVISVC